MISLSSQIPNMVLGSRSVSKLELIKLYKKKKGTGQDDNASDSVEVKGILKENSFEISKEAQKIDRSDKDANDCEDDPLLLNNEEKSLKN